MTLTVEAKAETEDNPGGFSIVKGFFKGLLFGVMLICVVLIVATFVAPRIIGAVPLTVLTGSMVPTFNPGDLIVTMPVDDAKEEIKRGDIITFQPESGVSTLITHRVVSTGFTIGGDTLFVTKGDANNAQDEPILEDQVMGKYLYHIPYLGYLANAIPNDNKPVIIQLLGVAVFGWVFIQIITSIVSSVRKKKRLAKESELEFETTPYNKFKTRSKESLKS